MFRNQGGLSPARWLATLPSGARVELVHGAILVKQVSRWMSAGVIDRPLTCRAVIRSNRGHRPTLLVLVGGIHRVAP